MEQALWSEACLKRVPDLSTGLVLSRCQNELINNAEDNKLTQQQPSALAGAEKTPIYKWRGFVRFGLEPELGRAPVVARIHVYSETNGSSRWLPLSCATESVVRTVVVQHLSIAPDAFAHKPVARRTQSDQVQLRIVTGVTAKFSVMNLQVLHVAARLTAKAIPA